MQKLAPTSPYEGECFVPKGLQCVFRAILAYKSLIQCLSTGCVEKQPSLAEGEKRVAVFLDRFNILKTSLESLCPCYKRSMMLNLEGSIRGGGHMRLQHPKQ